MLFKKPVLKITLFEDNSKNTLLKKNAIVSTLRRRNLPVCIE